MAISLLAMSRLFQESFILGEATSSHFFGVITLLPQLLFQSSCIFRASAFFDQLLFQNNYHFFAAVIFSEQLLFQSKTSTEQLPLGKKKFFGEATFRNSYLFWRRNCLEWRYLQKSCYFFEAGTSAQHQLFQKSYILGEKKQFFRKAIFRITHFFGELRFYSSYFFKRRYLLQQQPFQKSCFFAT